MSPIVTVAVLATAVRVGVIPATDRLLLLFLLMQGATPSAMFLGVMTQMHHDAEREAIMSQLLFVLNIAAIPLFTVSRHYATNRLLWPGVFCSCYGCCTTHSKSATRRGYRLLTSCLLVLAVCSVGFFDDMRSKQRYCFCTGVT